MPESDRVPRSRCLGILGVLLPAWLILLIPGAQQCLVYDRAAILQGEAWRLVTGHWVHFSASHLLADSIAWTLAMVCVGTGKFRRLALAVTLAIGAIPLTLWCLQPGLSQYAGLSGLGMAAWAFIAADGWRRRGMRRWTGAWIATVLLMKLALEWSQGTFLWMSPQPGVEPATLAHAVGALCGTMLCIERRQGTLERIQACDEEPSTP